MFSGEEKRRFSRLSVTLGGIMYIRDTRVPITLADISELGIGFRLRYSDCQEDLKISMNDDVVVEFLDIAEGKEILQRCCMKVAQIREHSHHSFIGCELVSSDTDFIRYVQAKKKERIEIDAMHLEEYLSSLVSEQD